MKTPIACVVAGALLASATLLRADWPRWRGPRNDGHLPPDAPGLSSLPASPEVIWQTAAGGGLASPVVAGGRVLAFDNQNGRETLRALDAATGAELWRADIDEPFTDSQGPTGPRNTPVIDGDRVYAVSCRGELQCRRLEDGALVWRANYVSDFGAEFIGEKGSAPGASRHGNNGSPLVDGEHLIAFPGGKGAGVVCFNKRDGAVIWKSSDDQAAYAPPVVATLGGLEQVVCFTVEGLLGLRRSDGAILWRVPVKTAFARHVTTPLVRGEWVVVSSHQAGLLGIRVTRNGDLWTAETAWTSKKAAINFASPVAVDGFLYGVGPNRDLVCVAIETGETQWSQGGVFHTSGGKTHGGFIVTTPKEGGGEKTVLTLTDMGELVLFAADPKGYRELGRTQVSGVNWCNPALSKGALYLRDGLSETGTWKAIRLSAAPGS